MLGKEPPSQNSLLAHLHFWGYPMDAAHLYSLNGEESSDKSPPKAYMLKRHVFTAVGEPLTPLGLSLLATNNTCEKEKQKRAAEITKELKKLRRELAEILGMPCST